MIEDWVQDLNSVTCGTFQLYFYANENSKTEDQTRLNKRTIETLLNELFVLNDQETNEATLRQYASGNNIMLTFYKPLTIFAKKCCRSSPLLSYMF